jgi:hypothetical protein
MADPDTATAEPTDALWREVGALITYAREHGLDVDSAAEWHDRVGPRNDPPMLDGLRSEIREQLLGAGLNPDDAAGGPS